MEASSVSERKRRLAEYLKAAHAATWPVLSGLTEVDLPRRVFGDGDALWTVADLMAHLADAESGILGQVQRLLAGKLTVPDDFDLDRWNRSAVRRGKGRRLPDLLEDIRRAHGEALSTLEATDETSLDRKGRHSSGDVLTVEGFFRRMADHRRGHTADIERALKD
jgi:hypothetical protein